MSRRRLPPLETPPAPDELFRGRRFLSFTWDCATAEPEQLAATFGITPKQAEAAQDAWAVLGETAYREAFVLMDTAVVRRAAALLSSPRAKQAEGTLLALARDLYEPQEGQPA